MFLYLMSMPRLNIGEDAMMMNVRDGTCLFASTVVYANVLSFLDLQQFIVTICHIKIVAQKILSDCYASLPDAVGIRLEFLK